jgi:hypothetical protein
MHSIDAATAPAAAQFSASWPLDAAALHGEFKRDLIAAGICALVMMAVWAIQEWDPQRSSTPLGWFGGMSLLVAASGIAMLIAVGGLK